MPRKPRIHLPGGFYHVILRGNGRQAIFFDSTDRQTWEDLLRVSLHRHQHRLHAYCWMTNHIHMAVQAGTAPLAKFMSHLASGYARYLNRKMQRPGHLFERRYRAILVQADSYLQELLRYIHLNPLRAHMVEDLTDYEWSSHHAYLGKGCPNWLTVEYLLQQFGATERLAHHRYREFVNQTPPAHMLAALRKGAAADDRLIGDDQWTRAILNQPLPPSPAPTLDELIHAACQRHHVTEAMLASKSRSRQHSDIRAEIALAATDQNIATVTEIARRFGRAHSGLSRAMNRLRDNSK
jgi:REP element-mobilizing transposase RayT